MPEPIQIASVRLVEMPADQMTRVMAQSGVSWYLLTVTLHNPSDAPVYVMADIRRITYQRERRTLDVRWSEEAPPAERRVLGRPRPPRHLAIPAGAETRLTHPLSSPLTFVDTGAENARQSTYVRITEDVDTIECTIAYQTQPPEPVPDLTALAGRARAHAPSASVMGSWKNTAAPPAADHGSVC
jgi:hypothetical protein